jgi:hypothetical protein
VLDHSAAKGYSSGLSETLAKTGTYQQEKNLHVSMGLFNLSMFFSLPP